MKKDKYITATTIVSKRARSLPRIEATLQTLGLDPILATLRSGKLEREVELPFASVKTAKTVQRLLYNWLYFYPEVKDTVSVRLSTTLPLITLIPRLRPERRGRRGLKV